MSKFAAAITMPVTNANVQENSTRSITSLVICTLPDCAVARAQFDVHPNQITSWKAPITHPTQSLCTLRVRRRRRLTQHSLPGSLLGLTWAGLAPADRASFAGAFSYSITSSAVASIACDTVKRAKLALAGATPEAQ